MRPKCFSCHYISVHDGFSNNCNRMRKSL